MSSSFSLGRGLGLAIATAVVCALTAPTAVAAPAPPAPAKTKPALSDDFNGDGYRDVVTASPYAFAGIRKYAGNVTVLYGSKSGTLRDKWQWFDQSQQAPPASAERYDHFGTAVTSADLDADGYADLVVGAPGDDGPGGEPADIGSLSIFWGGKNGLGRTPAVISGTAGFSAIGGRLVAGDVNGDGTADLVTAGVSSAWTQLRTYAGPFKRDGSPAGVTTDPGLHDEIRDLAAGDHNGDGITDVVAVENQTDLPERLSTWVWKGTARGLVSTGKLALKWEQGGDSVDLGDINGDGFDDIVQGREEYSGDYVPPGTLGGMFGYIPGSAKGPVAGKAKFVNQGSPGVPGAVEHGDGFGSEITVGDVNGDKYADIAVGVPGEDFGGKSDAGAVVILRGGKNGIATSGGTVFSQDTSGVPGAAEKGDLFGGGVKLVDVNRDGRADLVAGAPGENSREGAVSALKGGASGITAKGSITVTPRGLGHVPNPGDRFGLVFGH
ncbi:FG-GAP and VCBS repeat-containing protein [Streptomyces sp. NPDC000594]|uniref:FG-GAP and VCBS repeat-containing protein n=1 Tax=Streptomyces sp. NPDC000594 TaxID=3154261 RepID=UPI003327D5F2